MFSVGEIYVIVDAISFHFMGASMAAVEQSRGRSQSSFQLVTGWVRGNSSRAKESL